MADENKVEPSNAADDAALNGLPEKERKETQTIIDELGGDASKGGDKKPADPAKPDEKKPDQSQGDKKPDEKKPDESTEGKPKDGDKKPPEARRNSTLIPAWIHEMEKDRWSKREAELLAQVETASKGVISREEKKGGEATDVVETDIDADAKEIADKEGISVTLAKSLILAAVKRGGKVTADITAKLAEVDKLRSESEVKAETAKFNADFDSQILPLVKAEYGETTPPEIVEKIREDLKAKAYSPEYSKIPYTTIYKGEDQFRGVIPPEKKGAEGSRGGSTAVAGGAGAGDAEQIDLTKQLTEEQLKGLTDAQFDEYSKNMAKAERPQQK